MWEWLSNWTSNPTSILAAIAVIALIWQVGRWTQRIENGLQTLGDRIDAQGTALEERVDAQVTALEERIDTGLKTLRDEVRQQQAETRRTLDILLLRVGGVAETATGNSPLKLTELGKRIEASLEPTEWIAATAEQMRPRAAGLEPFEIDALCQEYVRNSLDDEWRHRVLRAVYEFGSDERAVEDVLRILLRDALLTRSETPPNAPRAT